MEKTEYSEVVDDLKRRRKFIDDVIKSIEGLLKTWPPVSQGTRVSKQTKGAK